MTASTRFTKGDLVQLPRRLGSGVGVVVQSWRRPLDGAEICTVQHEVGDHARATVVCEDELLRVGRIEVPT
jgi:hypothetical protein